VNYVFGNQVFGTLTMEDKPAIAAVLEAAGIEGVEASLSQSGTVFFVLTKPTGLGNDPMQNPELRQRIVTAFEEAGWTWGPALSLVAAPAPEDGTPQEELWTTQQVADHLGITRDAARKQLSRWGITAAYRYPEARNLYGSLFLASKVRAAHASRPGKGSRTDLKTAADRDTEK
jgi:hypothetical protein